MQFPSSVHDLRREHYAIAGIPTYDHDDWTAYLQIPPKGALCATVGRINAGEVEFFVWTECIRTRRLASSAQAWML